jgi:hypothetical protein
LTHGAFSIQEITWKTTDWFDTAKGVWKPITSHVDPGYEYRNPITLNDEVDIKAHIEFQDCHTLKIKLPSSAEHKNYPANKLPKDASGKLTSRGFPVQILINIFGCYVEADFNGAALEGDIWMTTFAGSSVDNGLGTVLLHELGHNMGQVYANKTTDATFGRPVSNQIPGIPFPPDVNNGGISYGEHDHTGTHCAAGLLNKAAHSFQTAEAFSQATCIMFGASDLKSKKVYDFCGECKTYIKAEDLSSIRKYWA